MAKTESPDPFVCNDEVEVDEETAAAIDLGTPPTKAGSFPVRKFVS